MQAEQALSGARTPLNVFLTVDTEIWPFCTGWPTTPLPSTKTDFSDEINRYVDGVTLVGDFGVPFQTRLLNEHGLKATYFVEALAASVIGMGALQHIVGLVQDSGQEVGLHVHTEWLGDIPTLGLPRRQNIHEYGMAEQARIIAAAAENLRQCGVTTAPAFRAGNFGANSETLHALRENGFAFDTSLNVPCLGAACQMAELGECRQPVRHHGVWEFPVTYFSDYPGHYRHMQLCACSFAEMREALLWAWRNGWCSFVIVLHSFELLKNHNRPETALLPNKIVVSRFEKLCRFLAANPDKFRAAVFSDLDAAAIPELAPRDVYRSALGRTVFRHVEQVVGEWL